MRGDISEDGFVSQVLLSKLDSDSLVVYRKEAFESSLFQSQTGSSNTTKMCSVGLDHFHSSNKSSRQQPHNGLQNDRLANGQGQRFKLVPERLALVCISRELF